MKQGENPAQLHTQGPLVCIKKIAMRYNFYIILVLLSIISLNLSSQIVDTSYYNKYNRITDKYNYNYYKIINQSEEKLFIREFYKSGKLKNEEIYLTSGVKLKLKKLNKLIESGKIRRDGLFVGYDSTGTKIHESQYSNGELEYGPLFFHESGDTLYGNVDVKPEFLEKDGFRAFIANNLKYPEIAQKNGITGTVYVQFVVDKNGDVKYVKIVRGIDPSLDNEAMRVIKLSPKWQPGILNKKPVGVIYTMPIVFMLN